MYLYYATEENCYETEKHETENAQGYGIIIGFAHFGKCWCVSNHISEERKIAVAYCK